MNNVKKLIFGGITAVGLAVAGYRTYELRKLRKSIEEDQIIDVEPEKIEDVSDLQK